MWEASGNRPKVKAVCGRLFRTLKSLKQDAATVEEPFEADTDLVGAEHGIVVRELGSIESKTCYITYTVVILL